MGASSKHFCALVLAAGVLSACTGQWRLPSGTPPNEAHDVVAPGKLLETYLTQTENMIHPGIASDCDTQNPEGVRHLLSRLDSMSTAISHFERRKNLDASTMKTLRIGDQDFLLADDRYVSASTQHAFSEKVMPTWADLIKTEDALSKLSVNASTLPTWSWISSSANYLVIRDQLRLQWGKNFTVRLSERPLLASLSLKIESCLADFACDPRVLLLSSISPQERSLILRHKPYLEISALATKREAVLLERRTQLGALKVWVDRDARQMGFVANDSIQRSGPKTFKVPLSAGPFTPQRKKIAEWLGIFWNSPRFSIDIEWREALPVSIFSLQIDEIGSIARVNPVEKTLTLPWISSLRTFSHEFGHVLGLPDTYETLWNAETCRYTQKAWPEDLMSASWTGHVLEEHWQELDRQYPWNP
ncbi:MAG: immune inhibitor A domain-containing protein [Bdellovibrionota bacterium]